MNRLDKELVNRGLVESRTKGQSLIASGKVRVNGHIVTKPSYAVGPDDSIEVTDRLPYVARSGQKLEHALVTFGLDVKDKTCLDIGSSTGGFTDCLLQHGAKRVYAVDVGTAQLHPRIASDPRVINLENTDARNLTYELIPEEIEMFVADLSFISSVKVLPYMVDFLVKDARGVLLIKPQFELTRSEVKNGIITSAQLHAKAILNVWQGLAQHRIFIHDLTFSPIKGGSGNIEFLALLTLEPFSIDRQKIQRVVEKAHKILNQ